MDAIVRAVSVYAFLLVLFRVSGKRTLAQITTFDLVLLLIVSEAVQQAILSEDYSLTNAFVVVTTLVGIDILLSWLKERSDVVDQALEGLPLVIIDRGRPLRERMLRERVDEVDVISAARASHGLERLDQIKFAVVEADGAISVIPWGADRSNGA